MFIGSSSGEHEYRVPNLMIIQSVVVVTFQSGLWKCWTLFFMCGDATWLAQSPPWTINMTSYLIERSEIPNKVKTLNKNSSDWQLNIVWMCRRELPVCITYQWWLTICQITMNSQQDVWVSRVNTNSYKYKYVKRKSGEKKLNSSFYKNTAAQVTETSLAERNLSGERHRTTKPCSARACPTKNTWFADSYETGVDGTNTPPNKLIFPLATKIASLLTYMWLTNMIHIILLTYRWW